jgi:hypothetical protein
MANVDRMFQVIVLGGMALAAAPAASGFALGCGGAVATPPTPESQDSGFPVEGAQVIDSGAGVDTGFPQETAQALDSGTFADTGVDAFPQEGPPQLLDSGSLLDTGFPQETAQAIDSGHNDQ